MGLIKYKLGELLEESNTRNKDVDNKYSVKDVRGISNQKEFIETKANLKGVSLQPYKVIQPNEFVYMTVTSRNGDKLSVAYNDTDKTYIVSSSYVAFRVEKTEKISSRFLYMYLTRSEFDRLARIHSWGSARETLSWEDFCDIEIELPSLDIQKKYVAVYEALLENQKTYEEGLEDLKLACDTSIEKLIKTEHPKKLGGYIVESQNKNTKKILKSSSVRGISIDKKFINSKANLKNVNLTNYKIVNPEDFAYVTVTSRNSEKISIAMNHSEESYICSSTYIVFSIKDKTELYPSYLKLLFTRSEFDRYARFNSWGSARETFNWEDMCDIEIPVPNINIQKSIADIYTTYIERKEINEKLKTRLKNICPILIKGAMEEASREVV